MIFKNGFNYILMNVATAPVVGSVATFDFVYSNINCVYIIISARVTAMWVSSR